MIRLKIVKMESRHISKIAELEKACFSSPWSAETLKDELLNPHAVFFAAEFDDDVIAYAGMHHIIDEGYIANIAVQPQYRNKGVATALINQLDSYAFKNKLAFLTLEVRKSNNIAIALYKKAGFIEAGKRVNFYTKPMEDALIMTKNYKLR